VQGVGFRPFIYRLAAEEGLAGWVVNSAQGVIIEVESDKPALEKFLLRIEKEKPPLSFIQSLEYAFLDPCGFSSFEILKSDHQGEKTALVLPDIATCPDCAREIFDPSNRRYRYPFTNCTNCGPRFSIIEALPYDRASTTMKSFEMCEACKEEYENPLDRRFHAQPTACPECGPHLELWMPDGSLAASRYRALLDTVDELRDGKIVALKGLGGFQLIADASNESAIEALRARKGREEKPFAVMFPSLDMVREECLVMPAEERLLRSPEAPIVLLNRNRVSISRRSFIAPSVAPNNPYLGVMLPYTPLHHILMNELGFPIVATSGNLSDEPICIDEHEALERLQGIADVFLVHNRPIERHVDDSVVRIINGRMLVLRRARGFAPLPLHCKSGNDVTVLAVGGHLKNSIAMNVGSNVFISQHIGDLDTQQSCSAFQKVVGDFQRLYDVSPQLIACDLHPDYVSTKFARERTEPKVEVQHHYAHVAACMAENDIEGSALGVAWDGTGYGLDDTIWGGEFLLTDADSFRRFATFKPFPLPGGELAIQEPRRTAIGLLYALFGEDSLLTLRNASTDAFSAQKLQVLQRMLVRTINSPLTSSAGRLFDAVASIAGIRQRTSFEGQAAMELEFALAGETTDERYEFAITSSRAPESGAPMYCVDWKEMIVAIITEATDKVRSSLLAAKFHNTMTEVIVKIAQLAGERRVVLTGGCFQNKYLTERTVLRLEQEGFHPYWHQLVPPNDGGIAYGQVCAALRTQQANLQRVGADYSTIDHFQEL
jgi:hydrogenase maturation protein HypF